MAEYLEEIWKIGGNMEKVKKYVDLIEKRSEAIINDDEETSDKIDLEMTALMEMFSEQDFDNLIKQIGNIQAKIFLHKKKLEKFSERKK